MGRLLVGLAVLLVAAPVAAQEQVVERDFVVRGFRFASGETLPEVRLHYRTLGTPRRDAADRWVGEWLEARPRRFPDVIPLTSAGTPFARSRVARAWNRLKMNRLAAGRGVARGVHAAGAGRFSSASITTREKGDTRSWRDPRSERASRFSS
jgi:hypothetical protein